MEMKIHLRMIKTLTLEVKETEKIEDIKAKICKVEGVSMNQQALLFAGNYLEDAKTLADYNVVMDSTIDLYIGNEMEIYIQMPPLGGKTILLKVKGSDSIASVKAIIHDKERIPVNGFSLIYFGRLLEDNKTLTACEIRNSSTLIMALEPVDELHISLEMTSGKHVKLEVRSWYTIGDIKMMVESLEGFPIHKQRISYVGMELDDNLTLHECMIVENSILHFLPPLKQIFVKITGQTLVLMVDKNDLVARIKDKIKNKKGVAYIPGRFVYKGKMLEDGKSVAYYQIQDDSTLIFCNM